MSLHSVEVLRQRSRNLLLVTVPVSVVLLAIVIHFVFRYLVHRPLRALGTTMIAVESGDLSAVIPVVDTDEIGVISARFNRMVGHLKETVEDREALLTRVDGFNRKLEEKVEEATQALEEKNLQLQRVNSELYYLQRRLARSQRLTLAGKVTATFAHKLGTPLNLISGYIQTVLRQRHDENAVQEKLRAIHAQVDRLTGFIQNMLDETRTPLLDLKPLRLDTLLERILAAIEPALQSHAVHVEKKLGTELRSVMGDEGQLEQVFSNLVNNSLDAMPNGGTLTISTEQIDDMVRVRVSDTGEGISEAELPQIFRPLFTTKEIGRGTGLGLAIVKEILVAHGASIRVESQVDRGTTFILEFPLPVESREVMAHA